MDLMILAAADPSGPANMLATGLFWTVGIGVLIGIGKAFDAFTSRYLRRHVARALDRGDARILRAVQEREHSTQLSRRQSVPKQLTADRSHR